MWIYWRLVFGGTIARFWRAHWRFATFISYPHFLLFIEALFSLGIAFAFGKGLEALGIPGMFSIAASAALFVAFLGTHAEIHGESRHICSIFSPTRSGPGNSLTASDRNGTSASTVLPSTLRKSRAPVTPRKSSWSATVQDRSLGVEILARALKLDPALGRHGPRIVLLTIGGNFPIVGFHAESQDFRDHLRSLAIEPSIDWIDCQSRKDVMNFFPFDPIAGHGIDVGGSRRNPTIVPVRFREIIKPEHYNLFRWKFFRVHFQFVMANERPHAYDFFMIVCGPIPLSERMSLPDAALAIATGDASARQWAWERLESVSAGRTDDADLGEMEPTARYRG